MTKTQTFIASMTALIIGAGLLVAGIIIRETVMSATGSGLIGVGIGGLGLPRPTDVSTSVETVPTASTIVPDPVQDLILLSTPTDTPV